MAAAKNVAVSPSRATKRNLRLHVGVTLLPICRRRTCRSWVARNRGQYVGQTEVRAADRPRCGNQAQRARQMDFGIYLVRRGRVTADQYVDARAQQLESRHKIGELALTSHKLSMRQVMEILEDQLESPRPFGQLAVDKGYLTQSGLMELLGMQAEMCPSIAEVLVEQRVLDKKTIQRELRRFRNEIAEESLVAQEN